MPWPWRSGKGVITRHPVDFYPERAAWGYGIIVGTDPNKIAFVELYNNSLPTSYLRVYGAYTGLVANNGTYLTMQRGPVGSTTAPALNNVFGSVAPIVSNNPKPPGAILFGLLPNTPVYPPPLSPLLVTAGFDEPIVATAAPIAVIAPGDSLIAYTWQGTDGAEISFLYMWD